MKTHIIGNIDNGKKTLMKSLSEEYYVILEEDINSSSPLVVIDVVEGGRFNENSIKKIQLSVASTLMLNKIDRAICELRLDGEEAYSCFSRYINHFNSFSSSVNKVDPLNGSVIFCSGLHSWGFTIQTFSTIWSERLGIPETRLRSLFWGDNYYNTKTLKWVKLPSKNTYRGFDYFIWRPLTSIYRTVLNGDRVKLLKIIEDLGLSIDLESVVSADSDSKILGRLLQSWLPLSNDGRLKLINNILKKNNTSNGFKRSPFTIGASGGQVRSAHQFHRFCQTFRSIFQ